MKPGSEAMHKEVVLAFWKVHILHHASIQPIYGQWMLQELRRHDFDLSPGTLYPLLERMARHGWLRAAPRRASTPRTARREYRLTAEGAQELAALRKSVAQLHRGIAVRAPGRRVRAARTRSGDRAS
ncbi:MAG TPA: PadR family transcriptional regulator [Anaeromyxobacteraceae bacterium]|nr:PadR family transcriptional regulator [Anaeromyxobacteraceae bacterium]